MRKFVDNENNSTLFVGEAHEIKALAGSLRRAEKKTAYGERFHKPTHRTNISARYLEHPIFKPYEMYGLEINGNNQWVIHNSSTVLRLLKL